MTFLVKLLRLLRLLAWLLYIGALSVPHYLRRDRWTAIREMCAMIKIWGRGLLDILNVKVEVHGDESPLNGALVVSNHLGVLDILVHSSLFGFRFAPKSDIRSWPFLGAYVGLTYPIWVDRGSKARSQELLAEFHDTLTNGVSLIVYPEGTSSDGKHGVLPFKSTPFEAVVKGRLPVRPVLTLYRVPATSNVEPCWYGDMTLPPHIWDLLSAPGIVAEIHVLPEFKAPADMDRKALAEHVHALLQAEYERVMAEREKTAPSAKTPSAC